MEETGLEAEQCSKNIYWSLIIGHRVILAENGNDGFY